MNLPAILSNFGMVPGSLNGTLNRRSRRRKAPCVCEPLPHQTSYVVRAATANRKNSPSIKPRILLKGHAHTHRKAARGDGPVKDGFVKRRVAREEVEHREFVRLDREACGDIGIHGLPVVLHGHLRSSPCVQPHASRRAFTDTSAKIILLRISFSFTAFSTNCFQGS